MKMITLALLLSTSLVASAQQTTLNGVTYAPDNRLLEEYWEGFYLAKPANNPAALKKRDPTKEEQRVIDSANSIFSNSAAKVMALVDGHEIIWSQYKAPATSSTRLTGWSLGKTVAAMAAGKAVCAKKMALDSKVGAFIPELQGTAYADVTVENLLTMSSAIKDGSYYRKGTPAARAKIRQIEVEKTAGWRDLLKIVNEPRTSLLGGKIKPGEVFEYKEMDPFVLGLMVEAAVGMPFAEFVEQSVLHPVGTAAPVALRKDNFGTTYTPTLARMTLEDWIRFAAWVKTSESEPGCFGDYVRSATRTKLPNRDDVGTSFGGYGYFIWTENVRNRETYWASGFGGQRIGFNRKNNRILVVFSSLEGPQIDDYYRLYNDWASLP